MILANLLDHVLEAARRKRPAAVLLARRQFLAQPSHRPVQMMQIEAFHPGDPVVVPPAIRRPVGAAAKQLMQHGEEHRPLKAETRVRFP